MAKIRQEHISKIHEEFVSLTKDWTPDNKEGSLPNYLIQHGIEHMFEVNDITSVRTQLLNIYFFHEMYKAKNWTEIFKYWRRLGERNIGKDYLESVEFALSKDINQSILTVISSVAEFFYESDRLIYGLEITKNCYKLRKILLGEEHPDTLSSQTSIGRFLHSMERYEEAQLYTIKALKGKEKVLGIEHLSTLNSVNNMASLFHDIGRYKEAELYYRKALNGYLWDVLLMNFLREEGWIMLRWESDSNCTLFPTVYITQKAVILGQKNSKEDIFIRFIRFFYEKLVGGERDSNYYGPMVSITSNPTKSGMVKIYITISNDSNIMVKIFFTWSVYGIVSSSNS